MGREDEAYVTGSSRGRQLPMIFMLVAIVVATAVVAIGVVLGGGGMAVAAPGDDATIEATTFRVAAGQTSEEYAKCPANKRVVGGGVVQSGPPPVDNYVAASGPLDETGTTAATQSGDTAKEWYAAVSNRYFAEPGGEPLPYKVFALCSANSNATIEATSSYVDDMRSGLEDGEEYAKCPSNKRALGGGVVESGPPPLSNYLFVRASGPLDETGTTAATQSGDIATQWYAAVSNSGLRLRDFKVLAICQ